MIYAESNKYFFFNTDFIFLSLNHFTDLA